MNILTVKKDSISDFLSGAILCIDLTIESVKKSRLIQPEMIKKEIENLQNIQEQIKEYLIIKIDEKRGEENVDNS